MYSHDAFMGSVRTTPDQAYLFAKGEPIPHPSGETIRISGAPLDFLAVTDHAYFLGVHAFLIEPGSLTYGHPDTDRILPPEGLSRSEYFAFLRELRKFLPDSTASRPEVIASAWTRIVDAANRHDDPGTFTALIGYEYTPSPDTRHLHRNVIFRDQAPERPFSMRDSPDPADLWAWLDEQRAAGFEAMGIPHNMNQSDGLAFMETTWQGEPIDAAFAEMRMRNEPVAEITQLKGTSETHPSLSPNDEWADFEIVRYYLDRVNNTNPVSVFQGSYLRDALKTGLAFEERLGVNPYQLGVVAASDTHVSAGSFEEDRHFSGRRNTPQARGSAYGPDRDSWEGFWTPREATHGTGGLAGVWADENSRAAVYDAMRRRESFGTSGPRIRVRFFGGFGLAEALDGAVDPVATAYGAGVPMGGVLPAAADGAPSFLVQAMRDPASGWLQRAQVVKGVARGRRRAGAGVRRDVLRRARTRSPDTPLRRQRRPREPRRLLGQPGQGRHPAPGGVDGPGLRCQRTRLLLRARAGEPELPLVDLGCPAAGDRAESRPAGDDPGTGLGLLHLVHAGGLTRPAPAPARLQPSVPGAFTTPCGTCPAAVCALAPSQFCRRSSKNTSAPNARRNAALSRPPRNRLSSRRMSHARSVLITRSWARRLPRRNQGRADGTRVLLELPLQRVQPAEERLERPAGQQFVGRGGLALPERLGARLLEDALGLVREHHGVPVEGDAQLLGRVGAARGAEQRGRGGAVLDGARHVFRFRRQEQVAVEGAHVAVGARAAAERSPRDVEFVLANGVEDPQPRVRGVPRQQDDLDGGALEELVDVQELADEGERVSGFKGHVLPLDLVLAVCLEALFLVDAVALVEIEQGA